jgi:hypothetical protein
MREVQYLQAFSGFSELFMEPTSTKNYTDAAVSGCIPTRCQETDAPLGWINLGENFLPNL